MLNRTSVVVLITFLGAMIASSARAQTVDEDILWIQQNGFDSFQFMERCVSVDRYGNQIASDPLPVGGGWTVECTSYTDTNWSAMNAQASDGGFYCVLGQLGFIDTDGDARLRIEVVNDGRYGPAQLRATSSTPITITPATAFGVAKVWPLWLSLHYNTVQITPDPLDGRTCAQFFGIH